MRECFCDQHIGREGKEGRWSGQGEKLGCRAVSTKASADPLGSSEAGVRDPYLHTHADQLLDVDCPRKGA